MSKDIIVKKGLNINLVGDATKTLDISKNSKYYSVCPEDFHGVFPKLTIKVDEKVKAGLAASGPNERGGSFILFHKDGNAVFGIEPAENGYDYIMNGKLVTQ